MINIRWPRQLTTTRRRAAIILLAGAISGITILFVTAAYLAFTEPYEDEIYIENGKLYFAAPIEGATPFQFMRFAITHAINQTGPFQLQIHSNGGSVFGGLLMSQTLWGISLFKSVTIMVGKSDSCGSMCTFVWLAGDKRLADPSANFLFHDIRWNDSVDDMAWLTNGQQYVYEIILKKSDKNLYEFLEKRKAFARMKLDRNVCASTIASLMGLYLAAENIPPRTRHPTELDCKQMEIQSDRQLSEALRAMPIQSDQ